MDTLNESLPVYTVRGANWTLDVQMDLDDSQMSEYEQHMEAATKAVEIMNGVVEPPIEFLINIENDADPFIGAVLLVHNRDAKPEMAESIPAYIPLANGGFYMDSMDAKAVLDLEIEENKNKQKPE